MHLCYCAWAFCSCDEGGPLSSRSVQASRCRGFSCCRAWTLGHSGFSSVACGLHSCGLQALECVLRGCGAGA